MSTIRGFLQRSGVMFSIERNGEALNSEKGLMNREQTTQKRYIGFLPGTKIEIGDWLINPSGDRFFVYDKETATFAGKPNQLKCYIQTENEHKTQPSNSGTIFNIGSATGSVIGTQSVVNFNYSNAIHQLKDQVTATDSPDKSELEAILTLLEMVVNDQVPPQKGMFSKFADVLKRNSWFATPMMSAILGWLTSQIS